jgi:hypothetical protein
MTDRIEPARLEAMLAEHEELWAHKQIGECLLRYTRGIDRHDSELAKSAYHPDARDDHVYYVGSGAGLVAWADELHASQFRAHNHHLTNVAIELAGEVAHVESYFIFAAVKLEGYDTVLGGGRYIDRFECRDGRWAIAERVCICEWGYEGALEMLYANGVPATQDREDLVYRRPLRVTRDDRSPAADGADVMLS